MKEYNELVGGGTLKARGRGTGVTGAARWVNGGVLGRNIMNISF